MGKIYRFLERMDPARQTPDPDPAESKESPPRKDNSKQLPMIRGSSNDEDLRTDLLVRCNNESAKVILFTGTRPDEGVSLIAANFANALSRDPRLKTLLIDANLRAPSLHEIYDIQSSDTLLQIISTNQDNAHIRPVRREQLYVLPSGGESPEPGVVFRTTTFARLLNLARSKFDYVLLNTPSIHHYSESRFLCSMADGVVLVMSAGRTRKQVAISAKRKVEEAGGKVLGAVLNGVKYPIPEWLYRHI